MKKQTVLLTSGRLPIALEFARALKRLGARVIVIDSTERFICQCSSAVSRSFIMPSPTLNFEAYKAKLLHIVRDEGVDRIFPLSDDIFHLSRFSNELPDYTELFSAPYERLVELKEKYASFQPAKAKSCTVMDRGNILSHVVYESTVKDRSSSLVVKEARIPVIDDWILEFAEHNEFHGTITFDFAIGGKGNAIPVRCRPWPSSGYLVMNSNALAEAVLTRTVKDEHFPKPGRAQVLLPTLNSLPSLFKGKNFIKTLREIRSARDVVFDRKDWGPTLYQIHCSALLEQS